MSNLPTSPLATGLRATVMRPARWLAAAGLAFAFLMPQPSAAQTPDLKQMHRQHGSILPFFDMTGVERNCDYVVYKLRFGLRANPEAFLDPAVAANLAVVRLDFRDQLPAGLEVVNVAVTGDGKAAGGGAMPAHALETTANPKDTVTIADFRISADDLDGAGLPNERAIDIGITAKIDHAAFAAPAAVANQGFVTAARAGAPAIEIASHNPALPDDGDVRTGKATALRIDVSDCEPPPPPPGDQACFKVETGNVGCGPDGHSYVYNMPVGRDLGGKRVQLRTTTPGVSIEPPAQLAPAGGGVLHWQVSGAAPGDTVRLVVTGIEAYAGSQEGVGLCCTQTVDIVVPADLKCPPKDKAPDLKVEKRGDVARCTSEGGCDFTITVTNVGDAPYNGPVVLEEVTTPGGAAVKSGPNAPWICMPMLSPTNCTHPVTALDPGESVSLKLGFAPGPDWQARDIRNCAEYDYAANGRDAFGRQDNDKACAAIPICKGGDPDCRPPPVDETVDLSVATDPRSPGCRPDGVCDFVIRVVNNSAVTYNGPLSLIDEYPTGAPLSSAFAPAPWSCRSIGAGKFQCNHPGIVLVPGAAAPISVRAIVGPDYASDVVETCAEAQMIPGETDPANNRACARTRIVTRVAGRSVGGATTLAVKTTGEEECRIDEPCSFDITLRNTGDTDFSGPLRISDAIDVEGAGSLDGVRVTSVEPPFGCAPEPAALPISCVADLTFAAGEERVHRVTVVIAGDGPLAALTGPVSGRNCAAALSPDTPAADAGLAAGDAGGGDACHPFTISQPQQQQQQQQQQQCPEGLVANAAGRCACPEGLTFRDGHCTTGVIPIPTPRPQPPQEPQPSEPPQPQQCTLLPGQIRTSAGECVCPRGTELRNGSCVELEQPAQRCTLLPGQVRTRAGECVCPRGTRLARGACRARTVDCPEGTRPVEGRCLIVEPLQLEPEPASPNLLQRLLPGLQRQPPLDDQQQ